MSSSIIRPLLFDAAYEKIPEDEARTIAELVSQMRTIAERTYADYGHAVRGVHAKSHGLIVGELVVAEGLPDEYAQGAFDRKRTIPVVMRFSTNPGDVLDDKVSTPRGMALKLIGVDGERLPGSEGDITQDFVISMRPPSLPVRRRHFYPI
ncbi:hypothetical protein AWB81_07357 [Caballeronia arationis]|nr:hypothetical protein AWB81_07357 [Caballeronia arationis]